MTSRGLRRFGRPSPARLDSRTTPHAAASHRTPPGPEGSKGRRALPGAWGASSCPGSGCPDGRPRRQSSIRSCRSSTWRSCARSRWPARSSPRRGAGTSRSSSASCWRASSSGATGFGVLDASDPTFSFLGSCGFVLVMFVAGTHVPVRDPRLRTALRTGVTRAVLVGLVAVALGYGVAQLVGHLPRPAVRRTDGVVVGGDRASDGRLAPPRRARPRRPPAAGRHRRLAVHRAATAGHRPRPRRSRGGRCRGRDRRRRRPVPAAALGRAQRLARPGARRVGGPAVRGRAEGQPGGGVRDGRARGRASTSP